MHCNASRRSCNDRRIVWLIILNGYVVKLNLVIDDIKRYMVEKMEAIKDALDSQSDYLNYPLVYKCVKD